MASRGSRTATTPWSVVVRISRPEPWASSSAAWVAATCMKPLPPALSAARCARGHQRVVGPRERDPVDQHQLAGVARDVEALPEAQRAEQAGVRVADELAGELRQLRVALRERGQVREPLADLLGGRLGSTPAGEQPERATVGGVDQVDDLVELGLPRPSRPGGGRCLATYRIACLA